MPHRRGLGPGGHGTVCTAGGGPPQTHTHTCLSGIPDHLVAHPTPSPQPSLTAKRGVAWRPVHMSQGGGTKEKEKAS